MHHRRVITGICVVALAAGFVAFSLAQAPEKKDTAPAAADSPAVRQLQSQLKQVDERRKLLADFQKLYREKTQQTCGLSPENIVPVMLKLEEELFNLQIETEVRQQQLKRLEALLQVERKQESERARFDESAGGVRRYLEASLNVAEVAYAKAAEAQKQGAIPKSELLRLEAEIAKAKAQLQVHVAESRREKSTPALEQMSQKLRDLTGETAANETRVELLKKRLAQLSELRSLADQYKTTTELHIPAADRLYIELVEKLARNGIMVAGQ